MRQLLAELERYGPNKLSHDKLLSSLTSVVSAELIHSVSSMCLSLSSTILSDHVLYCVVWNILSHIHTTVTNEVHFQHVYLYPPPPPPQIENIVFLFSLCVLFFPGPWMAWSQWCAYSHDQHSHHRPRDTWAPLSCHSPEVPDQQGYWRARCLLWRRWCYSGTAVPPTTDSMYSYWEKELCTLWNEW